MVLRLPWGGRRGGCASKPATVSSSSTTAARSAARCSSFRPDAGRASTDLGSTVSGSRRMRAGSRSTSAVGSQTASGRSAMQPASRCSRMSASTRRVSRRRISSARMRLPTTGPGSKQVSGSGCTSCSWLSCTRPGRSSGRGRSPTPATCKRKRGLANGPQPRRQGSPWQQAAPPRGRWRRPAGLDADRRQPQRHHPAARAARPRPAGSRSRRPAPLGRRAHLRLAAQPTPPTRPHRPPTRNPRGIPRPRLLPDLLAPTATLIELEVLRGAVAVRDYTGPMALTLLAGPANAGKVALLLERYLEELQHEPLLIVPNRPDVDRVERDLLRRTGALLGGEI